MAEDYPRTLLELERRFGDESACRAYLAAVRWPEGFVCPSCQGRRSVTVRRERFRCADCQREVTVAAGTILQDSKLPLTLWIRALWHVTNQKNGISALGLQRALGLGSYKTAWTVLHKLRCAMVRPGRERLSGEVEVDETFVGGVRHGVRGRGAAGKVLVLMAFEVRGSKIGRARLQIIPDATATTLLDAVDNLVERGSEVVTDGLASYGALPSRGYNHTISRSNTAHVGVYPLPKAHRVASLLKRWLLGTHQGGVKMQHLQAYLDEFIFRFNRRTSASRGKLFYRLAQQAMLRAPRTYHAIKNHSR